MPDDTSRNDHIWKNRGENEAAKLISFSRQTTDARQDEIANRGSSIEMRGSHFSPSEIYRQLGRYRWRGRTLRTTALVLALREGPPKLS